MQRDNDSTTNGQPANRDAGAPHSAYVIGEPDALSEIGVTPRLREWVRKYFKPGDEKLCPICATQSWLIEPRLFRFGRSETATAGRALFPITCTECGYTMWINSHRSGIRGRKPGGDN